MSSYISPIHDWLWIFCDSSLKLMYLHPPQKSKIAPARTGPKTHLNQPQCFRCELLVSCRVNAYTWFFFFLGGVQGLTWLRKWANVAAKVVGLEIFNITCIFLLGKAEALHLWFGKGLHSRKIKMTSKKWRFGSDDFPFQLGDFNTNYLPYVHFQWFFSRKKNEKESQKWFPWNPEKIQGESDFLNCG